MDWRKLNLEKTKEDLKNSADESLLIIRTIEAIDELESCINKLVVVLREWYGLYGPRASMIKEQDSFLNAVESAKKEDMTSELLKSDDIKELQFLRSEILKLKELQEEYKNYLEKVMKKYCKNLLGDAGVIVGARLIKLAGSLEDLAKMPSSTIQVLGAEKALFRHLKKGSRSPKFGVLYFHPDVSQAKEGDKAKAARKIASKISIGTKKDFYGK